MAVHNYRSRQVHETLNGVNPSSGFRDMRSAKSRPNLWQIWQVFGPWASPYGANGQMSMTVHNYRPRQFHRTSNGENPSSGYRDMCSASLAAARPTARPPVRPPARPPGPWRQYPSSPEGWGVKNLTSGIQDMSVWIWSITHTFNMSCDSHYRTCLRYSPNEYSRQVLKKNEKNIFHVIARTSFGHTDGRTNWCRQQQYSFRLRAEG